jgi:hypothetical protein
MNCTPIEDDYWTLVQDLFKYENFQFANQNCSGFDVIISIFIGTVGLKLLQNYIWGKLGKIQREAMQYEKYSRDRMKIVYKIISLEFGATTLGLFSILLIMGQNGYIMVAIVLGNVLGVFLTYSRMEKDVHISAATDLLCDLHKLELSPNNGDQNKEIQEVLKILCRLVPQLSTLHTEPRKRTDFITTQMQQNHRFSRSRLPAPLKFM